MSKSNTQVLILPGETGWEVWSCPSGGTFELQQSTDLHHAGGLEDLPAGDLTMLFPLRSMTTVPMRVMTTEQTMFEDLAELHAERLGLSADPLAGQLHDLFEVVSDDDSTVLLSVWLKPPTEGEIPASSPSAFDLSARVTPLEGNAISIWRELGRWVFAIHQSGKLLYAQATPCDSEHPDEILARELKLALMQLSMQGLEPKPSHIVVWSGSESAQAPTPAQDLSGIEDIFDLRVETNPRPQPILPTPASKLLPEDVRAARRESQKRQRIQLGLSAVALAYVALVGWVLFGLLQDRGEVMKLESRASMAGPEAEAYMLHMARWRELSDAIDIDHSPVEILSRVHTCIPKKAGVRLTSADISPYDVILKGEAPSSEAANQFKLNLRKRSNLSRYNWELPDSTPGKRGREFRYLGSVPAPSQTP